MAKAAAVAEKTESNSEPRVRHWLDNAFIKRVAASYNDDDKTVIEIAKAEGVAKGQVALALLRSKVAVKDRQVLQEEPEALAKETVRLRNTENLSWGVISATLGVSESLVRKTYEDTTGTSHKGNRIGKGGRHTSEGGAAPAAKATKATKATTKKAAGAPAAGAKVVPITDMNLEQLQARLNGKTVTVGRGGKSARLAVKTVSGFDDGEMTFSDTKGASHTIKTADITKATR